MSETLGKKDIGQVLTGEMNHNRLLIWGVIEGPFNREDFDEDELFNEGVPDHLNSMLVVRIEDDGVIYLADFWYETEDEALEVVKYFKANLEPLEVT